MGITASPADMAQRVCEVLDPLLTEHGFASGQEGHGADSFQVLFCAAYDEFAARFPDIQIEGVELGAGLCVDLHVNGLIGRGLTGVDLEGAPLQVVLRRSGLAEHAASVESDIDTMFEYDLAALAESLDALFAARHHR